MIQSAVAERELNGASCAYRTDSNDLHCPMIASRRKLMNERRAPKVSGCVSHLLRKLSRWSPETTHLTSRTSCVGLCVLARRLSHVAGRAAAPTLTFFSAAKGSETLTAVELHHR